MKEHETDTAGRRASLLLRILSYAFTHDKRGSLDRSSQKYESQRRNTTCGAAGSGSRAKRSQRQERLEPLREARHSTQHARIGLRRGPQHDVHEGNDNWTPRSRWTSELWTRAWARAKTIANKEQEAYEGKRRRTQTNVFSDTESVSAANEQANKGVVRSLSRKTRRCQGRDLYRHIWNERSTS